MAHDLRIEKAEKEDWPYIQEKLKNYLLDSSDADWQQFFVAKADGRTVAFARIIDHNDYFEIASLGVDYYYRRRGIGPKMLLFLVEEARKADPKRPIYGVTHRPGFLEKAGFKEASEIPKALEYKKTHKCTLHPSNIKVMKLDF